MIFMKGVLRWQQQRNTESLFSTEHSAGVVKTGHDRFQKSVQENMEKWLFHTDLPANPVKE